MSSTKAKTVKKTPTYTKLIKRMVTEEELREVGRVAFGISYPGDPPPPKRKRFICP